MSYFETSDHRVWRMDAEQVLIDAEGHHWHWNGVEFDKVVGPELQQVEDPAVVMPLAGLAARCGLHSEPTADVNEIASLHVEVTA